MLLRELRALEFIENQAQRQLDNAPDGKLALSRSNNLLQYHRTLPNGDRRYLKKADPLVLSLAQKDYDKKVLKEALFEIRQIKRLISAYHPSPDTPLRSTRDPQSNNLGESSPHHSISHQKSAALLITHQGNRPVQLQPKAQLPGIKAVYDHLRPERQALVKPFILSDLAFRAQWESEPFSCTLPQEDCRLVTNRGDKVRSKSEVIIANILHQHDIPYRYEQPISLGGKTTLHPDFLLLNAQTRQEIVWEHFGLMHDPDYNNNAHAKIAHYLQHGFTLGHTLIATFESSTIPLDTIAAENALTSAFNI